MNVLLLGSGGRESAISWKIAQSSILDTLYIAPGNAGTKAWGKNVMLNPLDFDAVKKFVSPFQGIVDRILKFILFTLLGRAFTQLIGWFSDPKNKRKVENLSRFIKDWWPSLVGDSCPICMLESLRLIVISSIDGMLRLSPSSL